ncbi:hypothetical protein AWC26_00975 [Mycobacterium shimoidei]|uniref:PPE family protein PPE2 [Mycobacterium tuberculosis H37Rv] n=2 Tax=Mycobacterium shimoidei TaxID=29313 RepID=A0A375YSR6_MYCSH|nr:hypothetical protein AWC26_00975 [Mycobacterium shimoidei]SRX91780.1 PPE family protein PPE2 [Mycobacterium tuberculosis H37Rv] [Mycobacterium shimoidei]
MVGSLTADARRAAGTTAKKKAAEPGTAQTPAAAAAAQDQTTAARRRRAKAKMLGRGYEYMDLEPEPSDQGAGILGFAGTVHTPVVATGLATVPTDDFGTGPDVPMMPGAADGEN